MQEWFPWLRAYLLLSLLGCLRAFGEPAVAPLSPPTAIGSYSSANAISDARARINSAWLNMTMLFILYYDTDMLVHILDEHSPHISDVVVIDGPRSAAVGMLRSMDLLYNESTSFVRRFFESTVPYRYPHLRVRYAFDVWKNEYAQRKMGYSMCRTRFMLQLEGDLLVKFNKLHLHRFMAGGGSGLVASVNIYNALANSVAMYNAPSLPSNLRVHLLVDVSRLSFDEYFKYLWIIGIQRRPGNPLHKFRLSVGTAAHYTLARNVSTMAVKYAFYQTISTRPENILEFKKVEALLGRLTSIHGAEVARELFVRSVFESATCFPLNKYLLAPPRTFTRLALGKNTQVKKRFPEFDFPSDDVCTHTYLSGDGYYTPPEAYRDARRQIAVVDGFQSIVALNRHQANSSFVCLETRNLRRCTVWRVELALGRRGTDCADSGISFDLTGSEPSRAGQYGPIMKIPMIRNYTQSVHIRTVLIISCSLLDTSKLGYYWEEEGCRHRQN
jgi:hypothetical protein